jgi:AcrR family transcriptional regulator
MSSESPTRKYEKRRRAESEQATRQRIVDAAVELHGSVGPARTTVSELAKRAGVQRATVYRHFPDEAALFDACSTHWAASHPPPDPTPWLAIAKPKRRLRRALTDLYRFYRDNEAMLANVTRDRATIPALAAAHDRQRAVMGALETLLADGWKSGDGELRRAAISLALDFRTWQMLVRERGLADDQAVELMVRSAAAE